MKQFYLHIIIVDLPQLPEDVKHSHTTALALRRNVTLWYEQLDPSKVVPVLKDKFGSTAAQLSEIESYNDHPRAQAATILWNFFTVYNNVSSISAALQISGHEELVSQLTKGKLMCAIPKHPY